MARNSLLFLLTICGFLFCCDRLLSLTAVDMVILRKTLYYQGMDLEVHSASDKGVLYGLKAGAMSVYSLGAHPDEPKYSRRVVTINDLGFRDRRRSKVKSAGIFRIMIFGGSNTYGAAVSDQDTYPALLQKIFDERYPGRVEVWNAGVSAYVKSQLAASAEYAVRNFSPDLIVFQLSNRGRRPFLLHTSVGELKALFRKDPELYMENIPLLVQHPLPAMVRAHGFLVKHSPLYRICCLAAYMNMGVYDSEQLMAKRRRGHRENTAWRGLLMAYGEEVNHRDFNMFLDRHPEIPVVIFFPNREWDVVDPEKIQGHVTSFSLDSSGKPEEYSVIHPPSYVYQWYAEELSGFLIKQYGAILER